MYIDKSCDQNANKKKANKDYLYFAYKYILFVGQNIVENKNKLRELKDVRFLTHHPHSIPVKRKRK